MKYLFLLVLLSLSCVASAQYGNPMPSTQADVDQIVEDALVDAGLADNTNYGARTHHDQTSYRADDITSDIIAGSAQALYCQTNRINVAMATNEEITIRMNEEGLPIIFIFIVAIMAGVALTVFMMAQTKVI